MTMNIIEIRDLDIPELSAYRSMTEAQLRHAGEGEGRFIAESPNVIEAALEAGCTPVSFISERKHLKHVEALLADRFEAAQAIPVFTADADLLEALTGFRLSRGVFCLMERREPLSVEKVLKGARRIAVLEGVIDPTNIGAIFRSAAALGIDAVLVSSSCCDPLHRRAARVSMGSVFRVPWAVLPCLETDRKCTDMAALRALGFRTAALALEKDAVPIGAAALQNEPKLALLLGNEGDGLERATVESADFRVIIPMKHGVDSLNVAAAAAVAFYVLAQG